MNNVYILNCKDDHLYVGETSNPFQRFKQHFSPRGGCNFTSNHTPHSILGIYPVEDFKSFFEQVFPTQQQDVNNKFYENIVTEKLVYIKMESPLHYYTLTNIAGGIYTKPSSTIPIYNKGSFRRSILDLIPTCDCDLPAVIISDPTSKTYSAICAKKKVEELKKFFSFPDFCNFEIQLDTDSLKEDIKNKNLKERKSPTYMLSKEMNEDFDEFVEAAKSRPKQSENARLGLDPVIQKYIDRSRKISSASKYFLEEPTPPKREVSARDKLLQIEGIIKLLKVTNPDISDQLEVIEDIING